MCSVAVSVAIGVLLDFARRRESSDVIHRHRQWGSTLPRTGERLSLRPHRQRSVKELAPEDRRLVIVGCHRKSGLVQQIGDIRRFRRDGDRRRYGDIREVGILFDESGAQSRGLHLNGGRNDRRLRAKRAEHRNVVDAVEHRHDEGALGEGRGNPVDRGRQLVGFDRDEQDVHRM
jgi:hypothetical protein